MTFTDKTTGRSIPVSEKSATTINRALVAAHRAGIITDHEYAMTYAECVEPPCLPQMFGGHAADANMMHEWQNCYAWRDVEGPQISFQTSYAEGLDISRPL